MLISCFSGAKSLPLPRLTISLFLLISRDIMLFRTKPFTMPLISSNLNPSHNLISSISPLLTSSILCLSLEIHKMQSEKFKEKAKKRNNNLQKSRATKKSIQKTNKHKRKYFPKTIPNKTDLHTQSDRSKSNAKLCRKKPSKCVPNTKSGTMTNSLRLNKQT